jgi:hypothetical protein
MQEYRYERLLVHSLGDARICSFVAEGWREMYTGFLVQPYDSTFESAIPRAEFWIQFLEEASSRKGLGFRV